MSKNLYLGQKCAYRTKSGTIIVGSLSSTSIFEVEGQNKNSDKGLNKKKMGTGKNTKTSKNYLKINPIKGSKEGEEILIPLDKTLILYENEFV